MSTIMSNGRLLHHDVVTMREHLAQVAEGMKKEVDEELLSKPVLSQMVPTMMMRARSQRGGQTTKRLLPHSLTICHYLITQHINMERRKITYAKNGKRTK